MNRRAFLRSLGLTTALVPVIGFSVPKPVAQTATTYTGAGEGLTLEKFKRAAELMRAERLINPPLFLRDHEAHIVIDIDQEVVGWIVRTDRCSHA